VTVTGANGCKTTATVTTTLDTTAPIVSIANNNGLALTCTTPSTILTASGGGTYLWSASAANATTAAVTITTAGIHTVTVTGLNGCKTTATATTTLNNVTPNATATASGSVTCSNATVTLTATGGGTYFWSNSLGSSAMVSVSPTTTTTYSVTVTSTTGCTVTKNVTVTVNKTAPIANAGLDQTICSGTPITIGTAANIGVTYSWTPSNLATALANVTPTSTTTYTVIATGSNGCTASDAVIITVNQAITSAVVSVQGGGQGGSCSATTTVLECTANGTTVSYQWYKGTAISVGNTLSTLSVNNAANTQNTYYCKVSNTCGNIKSNTLIVSSPPLAGIQGNGCVNYPKTIMTNATITDYQWQKRSGSNCNVGNWNIISGAANPTYTPLVYGSYRCKVTFIGECSRVTGEICVNQTCPSAPSSNSDFVSAIEDPLLEYYNSIDWTTYDPSNIEEAVGTITIDENSVLAQGSDASNEEISLAIFPNPTQSTTTIHYTLPEAGHVKLTLITAQGTKKVLYDDTKNGGEYDETLDLEPLPAGLYYIEMAVENKATLVKKVVKM
jgi:hypothetical protein